MQNETIKTAQSSSCCSRSTPNYRTADLHVFVEHPEWSSQVLTEVLIGFFSQNCCHHMCCHVPIWPIHKIISTWFAILICNSKSQKAKGSCMPTRINSVDFDSSSVQLPIQLVSKQHIGQLRVLVRLQSTVRAIIEQEQVVQVQRLHRCSHTMIHNYVN